MKQKKVALKKTLRLLGVSTPASEYRRRLKNLLLEMYPDPKWTADELTCHPRQALAFCEVFRARYSYDIPDQWILKPLKNVRKRGEMPRQSDPVENCSGFLFFEGMRL